MGNLPEGTTVFHAQNYPGEYPSDAVAIDQCQKAGRPLSTILQQTTLDRIAQAADRGIKRQRLLVARSPGEKGYDPDSLSRKLEILGPAAEAGEDIRVAFLKDLLLDLRCARRNAYVSQYLAGIAFNSPQAAFWSIQTPAEHQKSHPGVIWLMNYNGDQYDGGLAYMRTAPPSRGLRIYEQYWLEVFNNSQPLREVALF
jgi:hypothetical protein